MTTKTRIGTRTVLASGVLILADGDSARVEVSIPLNAAIATDVIKIELSCRRTAHDTGGTSLTWVAEGDVVKFELTSHVIEIGGTAPPQPLRFGTVNGLPLLFDFAYKMFSDRHVVQYAILQGDTGQ